MMHLQRIERTGIFSEGSIRERDVDRSRIDRFVTEQMLESQKIMRIFIEVCCKGMPKGVTGETMRPAQFILSVPHVKFYVLGIIGFVGISSLWEEIITRPAAFVPISFELFERQRRQQGITIGTVLAMSYVYAHVFTVDVFTFDAADFTDSETRTVHKDHHSSDLRIIDRIDECCHFLSGRNKRYILVKPSHRDLSLIPRLMQNIHGEESELRDRSVDRAISEMACLLKMLDEKAHLIPGEISGIFLEKIKGEVEIR